MNLPASRRCRFDFGAVAGAGSRIVQSSAPHAPACSVHERAIKANNQSEETQHLGGLRMPIRIAGGLLVFGVALAAGFAALADQPTFVQLLARAQAEAEAGHRWGAPGDNLADTIMMLFQLAPTATP